VDAEPSLDLMAPILRISGLDNYVLSTPGVGGSGSGGNFMGSDLRNAYLAEPPSVPSGSSSPCSGLTGAGHGGALPQAVGLFEQDVWSPQDIQAYETLNGLPNVSITPSPQAIVTGGSGCGGSNIPTNPLGRLEVAGDIETVAAMAPGASIFVFWDENCGGAGQTNEILNNMAVVPSALNVPINQLSTSWFSAVDDNSVQLIQEFAAQGQSFFVLSGDKGTWANNGAAYTSNNASPPWGDIRFGASPWATIVGGTTLSMDGSGNYVSETTWDQSYGASGGGLVSFTLFPLGPVSQPLPWYQDCPSTSSSGCSQLVRNVPDVSAVSDQFEFCLGASGGGTTQCTGGYWGTSFSTPLWAAFTALINEQAQINSLPPIGFLNPALYTIGSNFPLYATSFNDVNDLSTNGYSGVPGFQAVTGYDFWSFHRTISVGGVTSMMSRC
jgi:subtilase family serine protease